MTFSLLLIAFRKPSILVIKYRVYTLPFLKSVFKIRIKNSDIQKGKQSGYRIIYHLKTPSHIILVTVYSKLEQKDISTKQIKNIIKNFDASL